MRDDYSPDSDEPQEVEYEPDEATALVLSPDWLLSALVNTCEEGAVQELAITVVVRGRVIRGWLITGRRFFEINRERSGTDAIGDMGRIAYPSESEIDAGLPRPGQHEIYMHVLSEDDELPYRIRIASVDAWSFGFSSGTVV